VLFSTGDSSHQIDYKAVLYTHARPKADFARDHFAQQSDCYQREENVGIQNVSPARNVFPNPL
jgi:hypothetical protein